MARYDFDNELHVPAPIGEKVTFTGEIVSVKDKDTQWGWQTKITVKVFTPEGTWLAWGTAPRAILRNGPEGLRGAMVEITAALRSGNDPHFCFMNRPSGRLLQQAA